jgi:hypothetical protein
MLNLTNTQTNKPAGGKEGREEKTGRGGKPPSSVKHYSQSHRPITPQFSHTDQTCSMHWSRSVPKKVIGPMRSRKNGQMDGPNDRKPADHSTDRSNNPFISGQTAIDSTIKSQIKSVPPPGTIFSHTGVRYALETCRIVFHSSTAHFKARPSQKVVLRVSTPEFYLPGNLLHTAAPGSIFHLYIN